VSASALLVAFALAGQLSPQQLIARWTVDAPGPEALVDVHRGAVLAVSGRKLVEYEQSTGAVKREHTLPCRAVAIEQRYVLCERALLRANSDGALNQVTRLDKRATALAVHPPWVAVARADGVFVLDETGMEQRLELADGRRIDALAFGPAGARVYAVAGGAVYVAKLDETAQPAAPETRRLVVHRAGARQGAKDGPFRARFGGATLDERAGVPRLSLAAAEVVVDLQGPRAHSVAAEHKLLAMAEGRIVTLYTEAAFGEEAPPPPPEPLHIDWPSAGMLVSAALIYAASPLAVALITDADVVQTLAIAGVGVLGSAAAVYGVIGLTAGTIFLFESTRPYKPLQNDPLGGMLNACGRSCWEVAQVFMCITGAGMILGGAALVGVSPFLYMLYDPAAGLGDAQIDPAILAAAGAGAGAGLLTWGLGFLPPEEDTELVEAREIPREVLAVAVGALAATTTWAVMRQTSFPR
jgi:hypothetical protein